MILHGAYIIITNCKNYGTIKADYASGIVSSMAGNVRVTNSANYGTIEVESQGGGIAALVVLSEDNTKGYIEQCLNAGIIRNSRCFT